MKKILVIGVSFDEEQMIQDVMEVSAPETFQIQTTGSFGQSASWWIEQSLDGLIIRLPADESLQVFFFNKIKADLPKNLPILFICDRVSVELMQVTGALVKVRILKHPLEASTLWKGLQELTTDYPGSRIAAHRYPTDQEAILSSTFQPGKMPGVLRNISVSGVYFEAVQNTLDLQINDQIQIEVKVSFDREYRLAGKIVWRRSLDGGGVGFGISFADRNDILGGFFKG